MTTTMTTPPVLGTLTILAKRAAVREVRRWLGEKLDARHATITEVVVLLASEVVTNAISHPDSGESGTVKVTVLDIGDAVRVEVVDGGSAHNTPHVLDDDSDAENGRGLRMLDALSRWGTHTDGVGRTVWFQVPITERGSPPEHYGGQP